MKNFTPAFLLFVVLFFSACSNSPTSAPPEAPEESARIVELHKHAEAMKAEAERLNAALRARADRARVRIGKNGASHVTPQGSKITVPDDYPTIQQAVDAAGPDTKIKVKAGLYEETVEISTAGLELTAEGEVTIDGTIFVYETEGVVIENFKIINGDRVNLGNTFVFDGGILVYLVDGVEIRDNHIEAVQKGAPGIVCFESTNGQVKGNTAIDNLSTNILISFCEGFEVQENTVSGGAQGIRLYFGNSNEIDGNICTGNLIGIQIFGGEHNEITDNVCDGNNDGLVLFFASNNVVGSDNQLNDNFRWGAAVVGQSDNNELKKNTAHGNGDCDIVKDPAAGPNNTLKKNETDCISGF